MDLRICLSFQTSVATRHSGKRIHQAFPAIRSAWRM